MTDVTPDGTLTFERSSASHPPSARRPRRSSPAAGDGGRPARQPAASPPLDDAAAWKAQIAATDELIVAGFAARASVDIPATVEAREIEGVHVYVITPEGADAERRRRRSTRHPRRRARSPAAATCCRLMGISAAARAGLHTWAVDYRMPPDHPYPTPLDDCVAVYRALLDERAPEQIVVGGGSAGGNLAAALMLRARDEGLPMPAALVLLTPEVDLTESGDTFDTNAGVDYVLVEPPHRFDRALRRRPRPHRSVPLAAVRRLQPASRPRSCRPGTRDLFLSNAVRMHRTLRAAGVDAELHVWEAMPHGGFFGAPEDAEIGVEVRTVPGQARSRRSATESKP